MSETHLNSDKQVEIITKVYNNIIVNFNYHTISSILRITKGQCICTLRTCIAVLCTYGPKCSSTRVAVVRRVNQTLSYKKKSVVILGVLASTLFSELLQY